jgi:hypothetical protein
MIAGRGAGLRLEEVVVDDVESDRPQGEACECVLPAKGSCDAG